MNEQPQLSFNATGHHISAGIPPYRDEFVQNPDEK